MITLFSLSPFFFSFFFFKLIIFLFYIQVYVYCFACITKQQIYLLGFVLCRVASLAEENLNRWIGQMPCRTSLASWKKMPFPLCPPLGIYSLTATTTVNLSLSLSLSLSYTYLMSEIYIICSRLSLYNCTRQSHGTTGLVALRIFI